MKKLLGLVFNRWLLLGLAVLVLALLIFWVGPLVAVGDWRPLDTARARWLTLGVLLLLIALVVGWRLWRARRGNEQVVQQLAASAPEAAAESADLLAVRERFAQALKTLRHARFSPQGSVAAPRRWWQRIEQRFFGRFLYELPWYLIIGAPGSGKTTALVNAGLRFPLAGQVADPSVRGVGGTRDCDWWFTDQAVLIDTAGRFTTQDSDAANDKATWAGFLGLLRRARPRQPLNGVLITVAVPDLLTKGPAERLRHAQTVRARVQELYEQLGERLPLYLLVTKSDLMAGFTDTFAGLDKAQRATPWGFTFPVAGGDAAARAQLLDAEFEALLKRLDDGLVDRLQAEADPQRRQRIYGFGHQMASLRAPLAEFAQAVFAPSAFEAQPLLRGAYFISGTQEGTPIDRVLGSVARRYQLEHMVLPPQRASGRSYFLQRLLTEVVFAEQGLAGTRRAWERRRGLLVAAGYGALGVVGVAAIAAWWVSWRANATYIETVATRTQAVREQVRQAPNRPDADVVALLPALNATRDLALAETEGGRPWRMGFGLYQGDKLGGAARTAYEQMLRDALPPRLATRLEGQLRAQDQADSQYEVLKAYLMLHDPTHFDAAALRSHVDADWDRLYSRQIAPEQRRALGGHLEALLALGPVVSPQPEDAALVDGARATLVRVPLPQRVYQRLRQRGLGEGFAAFSPAQAGGPKTPLVFARASGKPLTEGVSGLYTYKGYHQGFQPQVGQAARELAAEQGWVLGNATQATPALPEAELVDAVRRAYLIDYRDTWKDLIADIKLIPPASITQALDRTRVLAASDSPLPPLLKAMSHETTLLAEPEGQGEAVGRATRRIEAAVDAAVDAARSRVVGALDAGAVPAGGGPAIEHLVDDEFTDLRNQVSAPPGGKSAVDAVVARLAELQVQLVAVDAALKGGSAPQPSPLPNQIRAEAAMSPEPVRSLLDTLGATSARVAQMQLRESLARDVRSQVGELCQQAIAGRYPFSPGATRDVTPADFAAIFGPGGRLDQMQQKLGTYIDTSTRPWSFRAVDGVPLGTDAGSLPQFQRGQVIRETFFGAGSGPAFALSFKPLEMDAALREFVLDVDGQIVRYDHGPQLIQPVRWPGPRGQGTVRVMVQPTGTGMVEEGPWALLRLFDRVGIEPLAAPEKFRATFAIDGRKVVFEVTAASVRNPLRLPELRSFSCPGGL
ncbi:MAG: type VI secretion system membrane subunit TssM [Proteobacteria bacterium]|nr:type VI secretion system membrane subunit TssM [Pseudomonadota bacterium]